MKEHPIIFRADSVRAILAGRKTQTRRVVKLKQEQPGDDYRLDWCPWAGGLCWHDPKGGCDCKLAARCPYGQAGDRLWVRESLYLDLLPWADGESLKEQPDDPALWESLYYRADGECCKQIPECECASVGKPRWRNARFMPRWACRLTPEVTDVRVERLQDISIYDIAAEGLDVDGFIAGFEIESERDEGDAPWEFAEAARDQFAAHWDDINGKKHPWDSNDWVWVVEFKRETPNTANGWREKEDE